MGCMLDSWSVGAVVFSKATCRSKVPLAKMRGWEAKGRAMLTYCATTGNPQLQEHTACMEEVYENVEELDKIYAHVVKNGYEGNPATPVGLEPLIDVLPQNPILKYQSGPDEEDEFRKEPREWMKCQTSPIR